MWRPRPSRSSEERLTAQKLFLSGQLLSFFSAKEAENPIISSNPIIFLLWLPNWNPRSDSWISEVLRIGQKQEKSTMCNPMAAQALPGLDLEGDTIIENK